MSPFHVRRIAGALAVALTAGWWSATVTPAFALDGAPVITAVNPQWGPTAGSPVRIYGSGFRGVSSVTFGTAKATKFKVVDGFLITAVAPGGTNNHFAAVTVTDTEGSASLGSGYFYTNAVLGVTPASGLSPASPITVNLAGYDPNSSMVLLEMSPLINYIEQYGSFPGGPPPYVEPLTTSVPSGGFPSTDASGNYTETALLPNPFTGTNGQSYDRNIACPPNQATADYLGTSPPASFARPSYNTRCLIATSQFGVGSLDTPISYSNDPTPAPPQLSVDKGSAAQGQVVKILGAASKNWNANPFFGSSKTASKPGETVTEVKICGMGGDAAACSATVGTATVKLTRYINRVFSGATLSGKITVGPDVPDGCACFVRVRQFRPGGGFIEATKPLSIT